VDGDHGKEREYLKEEKKTVASKTDSPTCSTVPCKMVEIFDSFWCFIAKAKAALTFFVTF